MSLKRLAILSGAVVLCTAPVISHTSHSVQMDFNTARADRDDAAIRTANVQNMKNREGGDRDALPPASVSRVRPSSLRDLSRRDRNWAERIAESYSVQESSLELERADLRDPYTLTVRPSAETIQLKGTILLNGKTLKPLSNGVIQINLSPYLRQGRQTLQVMGRYRPVEASVEIALIGPSAETTQTIGGNGILNQTILITVQ